MIKKCYFCNSDKNIVFDISSDGDKYIIFPICADCKMQNSQNLKNDFEINELMKWGKPLQELESTVSKSIVDKCFPDIKFKKDAALKLKNLMIKYSIREVYQACMKQKKNQFNLSIIESNCGKVG